MGKCRLNPFVENFFDLMRVVIIHRGRAETYRRSGQLFRGPSEFWGICFNRHSCGFSICSSSPTGLARAKRISSNSKHSKSRKSFGFHFGPLKTLPTIFRGVFDCGKVV